MELGAVHARPPRRLPRRRTPSVRGSPPFESLPVELMQAVLEFLDRDDHMALRATSNRVYSLTWIWCAKRYFTTLCVPLSHDGFTEITQLLGWGPHFREAFWKLEIMAGIPKPTKNNFVPRYRKNQSPATPKAKRIQLSARVIERCLEYLPSLTDISIEHHAPAHTHHRDGKKWTDEHFAAGTETAALLLALTRFPKANLNRLTIRSTPFPPLYHEGLLLLGDLGAIVAAGQADALHKSLAGLRHFTFSVNTSMAQRETDDNEYAAVALFLSMMPSVESIELHVSKRSRKTHPVLIFNQLNATPAMPCLRTFKLLHFRIMTKHFYEFVFSHLSTLETIELEHVRVFEEWTPLDKVETAALGNWVDIVERLQDRDMFDTECFQYQPKDRSLAKFLKLHKAPRQVAAKKPDVLSLPLRT